MRSKIFVSLILLADTGTEAEIRYLNSRKLFPSPAFDLQRPSTFSEEYCAGGSMILNPILRFTAFYGFRHCMGFCIALRIDARVAATKTRRVH